VCRVLANWYALACILTTLSTFRGPIVQRASTVASVSVPRAGNMTLNIAQTLSASTNPLGFGTVSKGEVSYLSQNFTNIVQGHSARRSLHRCSILWNILHHNRTGKRRRHFSANSDFSPTLYSVPCKCFGISRTICLVQS
jgi:hypothetical protein